MHGNGWYMNIKNQCKTNLRPKDLYYSMKRFATLRANEVTRLTISDAPSLQTNETLQNYHEFYDVDGSPPELSYYFGCPKKQWYQNGGRLRKPATCSDDLWTQGFEKSLFRI